MRFEEGAGFGDGLSVLGELHEHPGQPIERRVEERGSWRQTGVLQPVCHGLGGLDEQHASAIGPLIDGGAKVGEPGRLEAVALDGLETGFKEEARGLVQFIVHTLCVVQVFVV